MSSSKSWLKWLVCLVVLAAGGYFGWRWYNNRSKETKIDYKTVTVDQGDITQTVTANGQIGPVRSVTVGSQVSGIITAINVDFNDHVTNNQIIAQIDPSTYQRSVTQAEADLANSQAGLELSQAEFRRAGELRTNALIDASDYDKAFADLHQNQAQVKMRGAALDKAKVDLDRTTIFAPIDGVVISRNIEVGQTVASSFNTPSLFLIANDLRKMRIEAMVSEADVGGVSEGQDANFTVDAFPGRPFTGKISQVRYAAVTNQNVVNYSTIIEVNNDELKLRPSMTANVSIITAQRRGVVRMPNSALRFRPPENAVLITPPKTNQPAAAAPGGTNAAPAAGEDLSSLSPEERRARFQSMSPEERDRMRAQRRGGPGGGTGGRGRRPDDSTTRTIYLIQTNMVDGLPQPALKPATVKMGITDGNYTEVLSGLNPGDIIATGINLPGGAAVPAGRSGGTPFGGGPFGGGGGGGFRGR